MMLGPGILYASAPLAFAESVRALRAPGQRLLGGLAMVVALPALVLVMCSWGNLCYRAL